MRASLVRNTAFGLMTCAAVGLAACDDTPLDEGSEEVVRLFVNPTDMVIEAEGNSTLTVNAQNVNGEPTYSPVTAQPGNCGSATVSLAEDPTRLDLEPPERYIVTAGAALGSTCIIVESGGVTDTVAVTVVGNALVVTAAPDTVVAGQGDAVAVDLRGADGGSVGGFDPANAVFSVDAATPLQYPGEPLAEEAGTDTTTTVVTITGAPEPGSFTTGQVGSATILVEFEDASGRATRDVTHSVTVIPGAPDSAFVVPTAVTLDTVGDVLTIGALAVGQDTTLEVITVDALGNWNTLPSDITSLEVTSSDPGVATVTDSLVEVASVDDSTVVAEHHVFLTVTGQSAGRSNISGTVNGTIPFGPVEVAVLAPTIASVVPANGGIGTTVTIAGANLADPSFPTTVFADGEVLSELFINSVAANAIEVAMPDLGAGGAHEITVDVGGVLSDPITYTQDGDLDPDEDVNNDPATANTITFPFDRVGSFEANDINDFFLFTLAAPGTVTIDLDWTGTKDLDILVVDGAFTAFQCGFDGATADHPEHAECALAAGDYILWFNDFSQDDAGDTTPVSYRATATFAP